MCTIQLNKSFKNQTDFSQKLFHVHVLEIVERFKWCVEILKHQSQMQKGMLFDLFDNLFIPNIGKNVTQKFYLRVAQI